MRFGLEKPIGDGVTAGLKKAFGRGGPFEAALDGALAPVWADLRRLRAYERRHQWHPIKTAPEWLKDGRAVLLSRHGDLIFGCWMKPDGEDPGYWDADVEYGGSPIEPPPTHFLILPKVPPVCEPEALSVKPTDASTRQVDQSNGLSPLPPTQGRRR